MQKKFLILLCLASMTVTMKAWTDDDDDEEHEGKHRESRSVFFLDRRKVTTAPVMNAKFKAECTSCHMAYPPGLLPARSWTLMMNTLDKHFGEDASLDEATKKEVLDYLVKYSSDHAYTRRGTKILATIGGSTPLRITETPYFIRKHDEIADSTFKRKAIGSKANCLACHSGAEAGNYEEHDVRIPRADELPSKKK